MDVTVKFLGGAGAVTGSKYLIDLGEFEFLVDCGLYQGNRALRDRNWDKFPMPPMEMEAIVLTHAHLDHIGYLPKLVKQGFSGPIYCTEATAELAKILLLDSGKLQEEEAEYARKRGIQNMTIHNPSIHKRMQKPCSPNWYLRNLKGLFRSTQM
ncbi:MBL fold metallo-hydrolase [Algoriphagus halophilus]|uniref:MBL fold metallo-hydrolase n=1 Tax=Algoriphagus halophilus TaxID=226505 RepID=UPI00358F90FD